ncbi:hypothetical protein SE15_12630 [Thermanaerothrix daxensis]|uniref:Uncharacterized protein n=1 Tax=Thermanaerothrix daxensis TaxID=869279 RepID=A0A0P6XH87_9CHLR|nr:hypothetical protein [Thermanaerothrix daxensis]KPL82879.1 hypothetical protein SE15_12630 [Thermanaerothrix daxensis]
MMESQPARSFRTSIQQHRKQVFIQIYFPLAVALLLFLILPTAALIFTLNPLGVGSGQWAAIALIVLISPLFILILLSLVISVALAVLLYRLTANLPIWTERLLAGVERVRNGVINWSDRSVQPVFAVHSMLAVWRRARDLFWQLILAVRNSTRGVKV